MSQLSQIPSSALQIAPPEVTNTKSKLPIFLFLCVLVVADIILFAEIRFARSKNASWLHFDSELQINLPLKTDPQQLVMTTAFLNNSCQIAHVTQCTRFNSTTVQNILHGHPPTETSKLLIQYQYDYVYRLFEEVSILGADTELPELTTYKGIYIGRLAQFAENWYLMPALWYTTHRRELDAVKLYTQFANLLRPRVSQGEWLSQPGIDDTDLPVITDLFCTDADEYKQGLCVSGILSALAQSSFYNPDGAAPEFGDAYSRLDPMLRNSNLEAYLSLWKWNRVGGPPSPPGTLTNDQRAAWHYATGVVLRERAKSLHAPGDKDACDQVVLESQSEFRTVLKEGKSKSYFQLPAQHQLMGIAELGLSLCKPSKE